MTTAFFISAQYPFQQTKVDQSAFWVPPRCLNISHISLRFLRFSWSEFLQKALPEALERAAVEDVRFREGLPLRALSSLGEQ